MLATRMSKEELMNMTVKELRGHASDLDIKGASKMRKEELTEEICRILKEDTFFPEDAPIDEIDEPTAIAEERYIEELKGRDTAVERVYNGRRWGRVSYLCPVCGAHVKGDARMNFCYWCGQRFVPYQELLDNEDGEE